MITSLNASLVQLILGISMVLAPSSASSNISLREATVGTRRYWGLLSHTILKELVARRFPSRFRIYCRWKNTRPRKIMANFTLLKITKKTPRKLKQAKTEELTFVRLRTELVFSQKTRRHNYGSYNRSASSK